MLIAIITFSDFNTNYGSMLQAFSLKSYLERQGHTVEFIRYREFNKAPRLSFIEGTKHYVKKMLLSLYKYWKIKDVHQTEQNFERFKEKYFQHTPLCSTSEELKTLKEYDCYICGSDQIWNIGGLGGIRKPYFLAFAPKQKLKLSYAASIGSYIFTDEDKPQIRELLKNLDFISVREKSTIEQVQALTNKAVNCVVDPVFLHSKEEWGGMLPPQIERGEYAVCYFVCRSKYGREIVRYISKKYKVPIYNLSDNLIYLNGTSSKYISVGPLGFASLIKNAKFTIGTSFHLAAFSIIFERPFLIIGLESNKKRIQNILRLVNLEDNFIVEGEPYVDKVNSILEQTPYYEGLNVEIEYSKQFLQKCLNAQKNNIVESGGLEEKL